MERRTGPVTGVEKPPLAPKPKFNPLQKTVPQALNVDCSQPQINTEKSKPCLSRLPTPEWKPVAIFTSEYQSHFQKQLDSTQGLLHSQIKCKSEINSGQASASTSHNIREFSGDRLKPMRVIHGQSHGTVKNNLNLTNGSVGSERNATSIPHASHDSSPTRLQPKFTESNPVLLNNRQRRHSADEQNGNLSSVLLPLQKASPIPVQNKLKSSHGGEPEKPDITSQKSGGHVKRQYKAFTVKENTLAAFYKEERTVTPRKQATHGKKSISRLETPNDNVELPGHYPYWKALSSQQNTGQAVPNNTTSESTPKKKSGTTLKPKVKSLTHADLHQSDGQRKSSFKKLKEFEFSLKKLFSKGGQGPETTTGRDEQSVDEDWKATRNQNRSQIQIPQYRTHHVNTQNDQFSVEHSVDGDGVYEHLYEDMPDNINVCIPKSPGIQTQPKPPIWQRNFYNKAERMSGKTQFLGEFNTRVRQDYNESQEYDEIIYSDDVFESSSEEEDEDEIITSPIKWKNQDSKRTKLSHIANEIVSSEKVFVGVLKLLHIVSVCHTQS